MTVGEPQLDPTPCKQGCHEGVVIYTLSLLHTPKFCMIIMIEEGVSGWLEAWIWPNKRGEWGLERPHLSRV